MSENEAQNGASKVSRRNFLRAAGAAAVGAKLMWLGDGIVALPASKGYLLVDSKKCGACTSCMAACSLAHEGQVNLSLARIQVVRNPLEFFPNDITVEQCRQCEDPACVKVCPTEALHVDTASGNVRMVNSRKCIGCMRCVEACPFKASRVQWNPKTKHSQKCDLCTHARYWQGKGPACVMACPMGAIKYTETIPLQVSNAGYDVNLRPDTWGPDKWYASKALPKK
jgi:protein NrfC